MSKKEYKPKKRKIDFLIISDVHLDELLRKFAGFKMGSLFHLLEY